jgi:hypothetical protein
MSVITTFEVPFGGNVRTTWHVIGSPLTISALVSEDILQDRAAFEVLTKMQTEKLRRQLEELDSE